MLTSRGPLSSGRRNKSKEWAHVVDVNQEMTNFHELIPDMAHQVPSLTQSLPSPPEYPLSHHISSILLETLMEVPFWTGQLPKRSGLSSWEWRFCVCCCAYFRGEDCCCRVCYCIGSQTYDKVISPPRPFAIPSQTSLLNLKSPRLISHPIPPIHYPPLSIKHPHHLHLIFLRTWPFIPISLQHLTTEQSTPPP